jgi:hypothetical protein
MAHRGAFVQYGDAVLLEFRRHIARVVARGLDDLDAGLDDHLHVLGIRRRLDRRQDGEIDAAGLAGHLPAALDLAPQVVRRRLRQRGEYPEPPCVRHRRCELRVPHPLHPALDDRVLDAQHFRDLGLHAVSCSGSGVSLCGRCRYFITAA